MKNVVAWKLVPGPFLFLIFKESPVQKGFQGGQHADLDKF